MPLDRADLTQDEQDALDALQDGQTVEEVDVLAAMNLRGAGLLDQDGLTPAGQALAGLPAAEPDLPAGEPIEIDCSHPTEPDGER